MINIKRIITGLTGIAISYIGWKIRINAFEMAWPDSWSYGGERENTIWAIKEQAYIDMGMALIYFGFAVILVTLINWLWLTHKKDKVKLEAKSVEKIEETAQVE